MGKRGPECKYVSDRAIAVELESYADHCFSTTRARSLRAVSEAPTSEELGVETLYTGASDTAT
jgi:hypothetical protein